MYLKQFYLGCLAHASYLIADERTKIAAVVDPQRDIDPYLKDAAEHGWKIEHVFLTHFHADFVAGHLELQKRTGAKIYLGARAEAEFEFIPVKEGDVVEFGDVRLKILETPGHTPESISILVYDLRVSDEHPHAVLTGDTLFVGDVGRPDLLASIGYSAEQLAEMLYDSLHNKLMKLPDDTLVYPAHGAGSLCGKNISDETVSTIGEQRRYNYALQPMSKEEFIRLVTADQPKAPDYFVYDAIKNRQQRPTLEEVLQRELKPLDLDTVLRMHSEGAQLLDVRDAAEFDGAHLKGALNIGLRGKFAPWCGTLLSHDRPIVLIGDEAQVQEAAMRLGRIGFDNVAGYLKGGMRAVEARPDLVEVTQRITARALHERLQQGEPTHVLDVRSAKERRADGFIAGSMNIPLDELRDRVDEVPRDAVVAVHCGSGYRSAIACSLLQAR
ncbi:MAG: MBL fold metallo-hydrolase, partial [Planctomycetota bacterium]